MGRIIVTIAGQRLLKQKYEPSTDHCDVGYWGGQTVDLTDFLPEDEVKCSIAVRKSKQKFVNQYDYRQVYVGTSAEPMGPSTPDPAQIALRFLPPADVKTGRR